VHGTAGSWGSVPGRSRDFSLKHSVQNICGLIHPPIQLLLEAVSLEIRWVGQETSHLLLCLYCVLLCDSS